jgi:CheY-like chemotaxis protein
MQPHQTILLVDPETDFLEWAQRQLENEFTRVLTATRSDDALKVWAREEPDLRSGPA